MSAAPGERTCIVTFADIAQPSVASVLRELVERRVLTGSDLVDRGVVAVDSSMSHRAFRLRVGDTSPLFVKRADPVGSQGRDLATEAAVYRLAASDPGLAGVMPRCRVVADDDVLVVLDDVGAPTLTAESVVAGWAARGSFAAPSPLDDYGRAVACIHRVRPPPLGEPPWFLMALDERWGGYDWLPLACRDVLRRAVSSPDLRQAFGRAASMWQASSLIHGDLRWSNVLAASDARGSRVWLVDWELACVGDPAWDVGSVIGDLVAASLAAPDIASRYDPLTAASRFLVAYRSGEPAGASAGFGSLVERSVALAGIRLVQTLVEYGYAGRDEVDAVEPLLRPWIDVLLGDAGGIGRWLVAAASSSRAGVG